MPPLTRWFIKSAFVALIASLLIRAAMAVLPMMGHPLVATALSPVFLHLFVWGWVTQMIFGVVYWMFPNYTPQQKYGNEGLWQATFWLFTIGLGLRVVGEPLAVLRPEALWGWLTALSALLQWLAALIFVGNTWGRVKGR
ncbi:MAG: hypothetical protein KDJ52_23005 [Anaerolineae bacterium]|nr:hypothetical protein [Anaerolineae bacterium]